MLCLVKTEEIETQRVRYDAEARKTHRERAEHRLKRPAENRDPYARGERDADDIIDERPEKILTNVAQRRAAEPNGGGNVAHAAFHKHNVRGVDGDVRSGADGKTDVRARERRGVVDAVAHHGDLAALAQLSDHGLLAVRKHPGDNGVHAGARADGGGSAGVIAREHHNAKPHALELPDGFGGVGLHNVRHGDHAEKPVVPGKIERCFPFVRKRGGALRNVLRKRGLFADEVRVAAADGVSFDLCGESAARHGGKIDRLRTLAAAGGKAVENGAGERMLALLFQRRGETQKLVPGNAVRREKIGDLRLAGRDRSGLIQHNDLRAARLFERRCRFEENAVSRADAAADHDGDRRGKPECARTADNEYRNAARERVSEALPDEQPDSDGNGRNADHDRNEHTGDLIGGLGDGRLCRGGVAYHTDDLRKSRILADAGCPAAQEAGLVDRTGAHPVVLGLIHGEAFPRERGLVHGARAGEHDAVHRDTVAGADEENVAENDLLRRNNDFLTVSLEPRCFRRELHKRAKRVGRFALGVRLQCLADGNERQYHGGGFKIEIGLRRRVNGQCEKLVYAP